MVHTRRMVAKATIGPDGMLDPTPKGPKETLTQRNLDQSPFLQLPAELRNQIYGYVFGGQNVTIGAQRTGFGSRFFVPGPGSVIGPWLHPGVIQPSQEGRYARDVLTFLQVCRQIYSGARLLPFSLNTFGYIDYEVLRSWSTRMTTQMAAITTCSIWTNNGFIDPRDTFRSLPHFPHLEQVYVFVNCDAYGLLLTAVYPNTPRTTGQEPSEFKLSDLERYELQRNETVLKAGIEELLNKVVKITVLRKYEMKVLD